MEADERTAAQQAEPGGGVCGRDAMQHPSTSTFDRFIGVFHAPLKLDRINKSALTAQKYRLALRGAKT
jgi:hypothetical protein